MPVQSSAGTIVRRARVLWCVLLIPCFTSPLRGADVNFYGAIKSAMYVQEPTSPPQLLATNAFGLNAFVFATTNGVVTNATLKLASTPVIHTLQPETNDLLFRYEDWFPSQAALDAAYPAGTVLKHEDYQITMRTVHDGVHTGSVSFWFLLSPLGFPATPQLANLSAGQTIDTTRDFQLEWEPLNAGALAIVQLTLIDAVSNVVFASQEPFQPGALTGSSTSVVIPAYSLPPGQVLQGHLSVGNPGTPNTTSYPGATGIAAVGKDTQFSLATRPAPMPPILKGGLTAGQGFTVTVLGETNRVFRLQASRDGQTWTNLFATNASSFTYIDSSLTNGASRMYRAAVGQ